MHTPIPMCLYEMAEKEYLTDINCCSQECPNNTQLVLFITWRFNGKLYNFPAK